MATNTTSSYIDIPALSTPTFDPYTYANTLLTTINTSTTEQIDLTTPLQRTLFDLQEIDTSIHTLTSSRALDIIAYTSTQNQAAQHILSRVEEERAKLIADYDRLRKEVWDRYERAEGLRRVATNGLQVARLGSGVGRVLGLARSFEQAVVDAGLSGSSSSSAPASRTVRDDCKVLCRACRDLLEFRGLMATRDGLDLGRINVVKSVRGRVFEDGEAQLLDWARKVIRDFSVSAFLTGNTSTSASAAAAGVVTGTRTYRETEGARTRFEVACQVLYLLSPATKAGSNSTSRDGFDAEYLIMALQTYLQNAVSSSAASIARGLSQLPNLDRACSEVSGRCQNVVGFEVMLAQVTVPEHPSFKQEQQSDAQRDVEDELDEQDIDDIEVELKELDLREQADMEQRTSVLELLLKSLDTNSLVSYFWRSLASNLTSRVQEIMNRGGVTARTLKSNRDMVRDEIRDCVARGSKTPTGLTEARSSSIANWEREAAVMVQSVIGPLNR